MGDTVCVEGRRGIVVGVERGPALGQRVIWEGADMWERVELQGGGATAQRPLPSRGTYTHKQMGPGEVWTLQTEAMRQDGVLRDWRREMAVQLRQAVDSSGGGKCESVTKCALAAVLSRPTLAAAQVGALMQVVGGMVPNAPTEAALRERYELALRRTQVAAAAMLRRWAQVWRAGRSQANRWRRHCQSAGAVFWAWAMIARRSRGEYIPSTRASTESGGREDWLPAKGQQWLRTRGHSAVRPGMGA